MDIPQKKKNKFYILNFENFEVFQSSVQKYFQRLLVIYFQKKVKAQRYVSKPTNSVW